LQFKETSSSVPQSICTATSLLTNQDHTSRLLSAVRYLVSYILSATPEIKQRLSSSPNASVWPDIRKYCRTWARVCQPCQQSNISHHTITPVGQFTHAPTHFLHIHVDLVGPLPSSTGFQYCITAVDRFTRWSEAFLFLTAQKRQCHVTSSPAGYHNLASTDQGRKFVFQLFHSVAKMCGVHLCRIPHHPATNGLRERLQRTLKAAIMCHAYE